MGCGVVWVLWGGVGMPPEGGVRQSLLRAAQGDATCMPPGSDSTTHRLRERWVTCRSVFPPTVFFDMIKDKVRTARHLDRPPAALSCCYSCLLATARSV